MHLDRQHVHPGGARRTRWTPSRYMDYVYEPEVASRSPSSINYIWPVPAAQDLIAVHAKTEKDPRRQALAEQPARLPHRGHAREDARSTAS